VKNRLKNWMYRTTNFLIEAYVFVLVSVNISVILMMALGILILIGGLLF